MRHLEHAGCKKSLGGGDERGRLSYLGREGLSEERETDREGGGGGGEQERSSWDSLLLMAGICQTLSSYTWKDAF